MTDRLPVSKTYKLYINGKFVRSESGRYFPLKCKGESETINICYASQKDFSNAVTAARIAVDGWWQRTNYNRGQILYRIAETMEGRKNQFLEELRRYGLELSDAITEFESAVDNLVYYAGWADKYQQVFSTVNPVSSCHFNFSIPENQGVIAILSPQSNPLFGIVSLIVPAICGGNTVVYLTEGASSLSSLTFSETLHASDVPPGVVNLLSGKISELVTPFASHMDLNGIIYAGKDEEVSKMIQYEGAHNLKRVEFISETNLNEGNGQSPYNILRHNEIKTTWHPIGN